MLKLKIESRELWNEQKEEFEQLEGCELILEHSLVSISKWEAKYHKPFLSTKKTALEALDYIKMMVIGKMPEDEKVFLYLTEEQAKQIDEYINNKMTATIFSEEDEKTLDSKQPNSGKFVTSEEIYYWMTAQNIPFECQYWHLNRLITLVKICAIYNKPKDNKKKKRMTTSDLAARRARMEAARKKYGG